MVKILALLFCLVAIFGISIVTMIYGWGLQPVSWGWIIGSYLGTVAVMVITEAIKACCPS